MARVHSLGRTISMSASSDTSPRPCISTCRALHQHWACDDCRPSASIDCVSSFSAVPLQSRQIVPCASGNTRDGAPRKKTQSPRPLLWRSLPDSYSRGRRSTLESAPFNITPRKKAPTWRWGPARPGVTSTWSKTAGCKSGRTRAPSRAACRGSLGFARIPTLAA